MNSKWESESPSRNLNRQTSGYQILRKIDPYFLTGQSFNVLLLEKLGGAPKARGKQGNQTALCARATRTMKLCSLDARSEGQSGHPAEKRIGKNHRTKRSVNASGGIAQFGKVECPRLFLHNSTLKMSYFRIAASHEAPGWGRRSTRAIVDRW